MGADLRLWGPGFHPVLAFYPSWTWTSKTSCSIFLFLASLEAPSTITIAKLPHGYAVPHTSCFLQPKTPLRQVSLVISLQSILPYSLGSWLTASSGGTFQNWPLRSPWCMPALCFAHTKQLHHLAQRVPHGGRRCSWRDHRALTTRLKREAFVYWHR